VEVVLGDARYTRIQFFRNASASASLAKRGKTKEFTKSLAGTRQAVRFSDCVIAFIGKLLLAN
jgi:hypothetical protein